MALIFCGVDFGVEKFCSKFGDTLLDIIEDVELKKIVYALIHGTRKSFIENMYAVTEYHHDDGIFRVSQIMTGANVEKFRALGDRFLEICGVELYVCKLETSHYKFIIGEKVDLERSCNLSSVKSSDSTKLKLEKLIGGNVTPNLYALIY